MKLGWGALEAGVCVRERSQGEGVRSREGGVRSRWGGECEKPVGGQCFNSALVLHLRCGRDQSLLGLCRDPGMDS